MMDGIIHAPDGITFDINVYATAVEAGLDASIRLGGLRAMAPFDGAIFDKEALLARFPPMDGGWRLMTREEIAEYLKGDQSDDED